MTTNTTPALADLDKIEAIIDSTMIFRHSAEGTAVGSLLKNVRVALARRAAQPVEPENSKGLKIVGKPGDFFTIIQPDGKEEKYVFDQTGSAVATPSPQVAEGAELPLPWGDDFEAWLEVRTGHEVRTEIRAYIRDAIAASRLATPAPASAGQAATTLPDVLEQVWNFGLRADYRGYSGLRDSLAAQPAEGAGQAGQVDARLAAAVNSLRWMLNITAEYDRPNMRASTLLDKHKNAAGQTVREDLEHLWQHFAPVRDKLTSLLLHGDAPTERAAAPADHEIREAVNKLRDLAVQFHAHQSLRDRIAAVVLPLVRSAQPQPEEKGSNQ